MLKIILKIGIFVLIGGSIYLSQRETEGIRREINPNNIHIENRWPIILDSKFIKIISLGHDLAAADLIWLDTVQYLGTHIRNLDHQILYRYLNTVTDLDPHFIYAYKIGELFLPYKRNIDLAIKLAEKGLIHNPHNWEIPFYLAYIYQFYAEDYDKAANYYELASSKEGALRSAKILSATSRSKGNKHQLALLLWQEVYRTNRNNTFFQKLAVERIIREENFLLLEKSREKFLKTYGRDIENIGDLVKSGILNQEPVDPQNIHYIWDQENKIFTLD